MNDTTRTRTVLILFLKFYLYRQFRDFRHSENMQFICNRACLRRGSWSFWSCKIARDRWRLFLAKSGRNRSTSFRDMVEKRFSLEADETLPEISVQEMMGVVHHEGATSSNDGPIRMIIFLEHWVFRKFVIRTFLRSSLSIGQQFTSRRDALGRIFEKS